MPKGRRKEKKSSGEKFEDKKWYPVVVPEIFGGKEIGKTPAFEEKQINDRIFEATLYDLTNDFNHTHIILKFKFKELVENNKIMTFFIGSDFSRDYLRSLVRRVQSRVDGIFNLTTKDGHLIRVTAITITQRRCKSKQQKQIRKTMKEIIENAANNHTFPEFAVKAIYGELSSAITERCEKIYPIRRSEVMKIKLVKMPSSAS